MAMKSTIAILASALLAFPVAGAFAQNTSTTTTTTAPTGTQHGAAAENPHVKGATGDTIVKGDRSTIAGDKSATSEQKTGNLAK